jgi:4-amino-4-deoxy-L-arabinose transferase-like glycosyltransferase
MTKDHPPHPNHWHRRRAVSVAMRFTPQLGVVLAVAAILRLYLLRQPFIDAFSWRQSSTAMIADNYFRNNWNILYPEVNWSGAGPSYQGRELQTVSYLTALLYQIFGQHDWLGRLVAIGFALVGIFALYQLVRLVWDEERATLSAGLMAVLPGSIFIERSFLPDAAMVALMTTSLWLLVVYLKTERSIYLLLAGFFGAWGGCTKISGLIIGLPMAYAIISMSGKRLWQSKRRLTAIILFGLLILVPVVAYYLWARHLAYSYPPYHFAGAGNWLWDDGFKAWWAQRFFLGLLGRRFADWLWTWPVIILVLLGLIISRYKEPEVATLMTDKEPVASPTKPVWLFHWWLFAAMIFYFIGAKELVNNPWNFHLINPAAAALAGQAIFAIATSAARITHPLVRPATVILLFAIVFYRGQQGLIYMYRPYAEEGYKLGQALGQISDPGALVVTIANDPGDPVAIYYSGRRGWVFPPARPGKAWGEIPEDAEAIKLFEELRAEGASWFGVVGSRKAELEKRHPQFAAHLERTCELKSSDSTYAVYRILSPNEVARLARFNEPGEVRAR